MKRNNNFLLVYIILPCFTSAQNIAIGGSVSNRAKFEVRGVAGTGLTTAVFGSDNKGVSLQRNNPAIGFNQYRDNSSASSNGRYISDGYAAVETFNTAATSGALELTIYPYGTAGSNIPNGTKAFSLGGINGHKILTSGTTTLSGLTVGRGTGSNGTAMFYGTNYNSHFNYGTSENTYIRGGKFGSEVFLHDIVAGGYVYIGSPNGNTRVGINYDVPVYTLEMRQVNGTGLAMIYNYDLSWEWRVSGTNLYGLYGGSIVMNFNSSDGRMYEISDERLKTNISQVPEVLDKIANLEPVSYKLRNNRYRSIGFIAQDVAPIFPYLVNGNYRNKKDTLSLNYNGFAVLAVKGIQESQSKIIKLKEKMARAEESLARIEAILAPGNKQSALPIKN